MDLTTLLDRAKATPTHVVSNDILAEAAELQAKERRAQAVIAVRGCLETFEDNLAKQVRKLRQIRQTEEATAKMVKDLDKAIKHFATSGNPLPAYKAAGLTWQAESFCSSVGIEFPKYDDPAWDVPSDTE